MSATLVTVNAETIVATAAAAVSAAGAWLSLWQARSARRQAESADRQAKAAEDANSLLHKQLEQQENGARTAASALERQTLLHAARSANTAMLGEIALLREWQTGSLPPGYTPEMIRASYDAYLLDLAEARAAATNDFSVSAVEVIESAVTDATKLRRSVCADHPVVWGAEGREVEGQGAVDQVTKLMEPIEQMQWLAVQLASPGRGVLARAIAEHLSASADAERPKGVADDRQA